MGKLTNLFSNISSQVKKTFTKFPITIILVYILTVFLAIFLDSDIITMETFEKIIFVGGVSLLGILLVEANKEKMKLSIQRIGVGLAFGIAFVFYIILDSATNDNILFITRCFLAYIISISIFTLYSLIKNSGVEFKEYVLKAFSSVFKFTIVYGILNIGILLLSLAFIELILDGEGWSLVGRMLILLLGFFYIPVILHSLSEMKVEVSKFVRGLILYVLLPLIAIGMVIIYMYIFKITINGELPKNSIFAMLAIIFVFLYPICIMASNYNSESETIRKISKILMFLYIPFIILEIYAMNLRVESYGITPPRYLAYVFIIFQVVFIFLTLFKNSKYIKESLLVAIALVCIILITPLDPERVSNISQKKILEEYIENGVEFEDCSDKEKARYAGAYQYLEGIYEEYIPDLTEDEKEEMSNYNNYYWNDGYYYEDYRKYKNLYYTNDLDGLDISEYSKIYEINRIYGSSNNYRNYQINVENKKIYIDLERYVQRLIEEDDSRFFEANSLVETKDENFDIYIMYIDISYDTENEEIENVIVDGYILEK